MRKFFTKLFKIILLHLNEWNFFFTDIKYTECSNNLSTVNILKDTQLTFAIHVSLHVHVKVINMDCCINKVAWCFSTEGLINVGQDEIVILLEYLEEESTVPKDIFYHISTVYNDAVKGNFVILFNVYH